MDLNLEIEKLEEKIRQTPHHKGTEHQIGRWRARMAKFRHQMWGRQSKKAGAGEGFGVKKSGDATVVLVGPPSVGKSSLINRLANVKSRVGSYDFTTLTVIPGMMKYQGAMIQIFDLPGIIKGASEGKGRGREVLSVVRSADLVLIMVDPARLNLVESIKQELASFGLRLDQTPPKVTLKKASRGGVKIVSTTPLTQVSHMTVEEIAKEFRLNNAEIVIKEDITLDRLIDAFATSRLYLPYLVAVNKIDTLADAKRLPAIGQEAVLISASQNQGLEALRQAIWEKLALMRVYLKPKTGPVDLDEPLIAKKGMNLNQILAKIMLPGKEEIKKAKISGPGAKFEGQQVSLSFQPQEGTIISFLG